MAPESQNPLDREVDDIDPKLDALLREQQLPRASAELRAELKRNFVQGDFAGQDPEPALARVLDALPDEKARVEFREALRVEFLDVERKGQVAQPMAPAARSKGRTLSNRPSARRRRRDAGKQAPRSARRQSWRVRALSAGVLAAAAAVTLLLWRPWNSELGPWRVDLTSYQAGTYVVDGELLSADLGPDDISKRLRNAVRVGVNRPLGQRLVFGKSLVLEFVSSEFDDLHEYAGNIATEIDVSGMPDVPSKGNFSIRLVSDEGGLALATGPDFEKLSEGRSLLVSTPDTEVSVLGTVFGVDRYPNRGTCVCCLKGLVSTAGCKSGWPDEQVQEGHMRFVHPSEEPMAGVIMPHHRKPLERLAGYFP